MRRRMPLFSEYVPQQRDLAVHAQLVSAVLDKALLRRLAQDLRGHRRAVQLLLSTPHQRKLTGQLIASHKPVVRVRCGRDCELVKASSPPPWHAVVQRGAPQEKGDKAVRNLNVILRHLLVLVAEGREDGEFSGSVVGRREGGARWKRCGP